VFFTEWLDILLFKKKPADIAGTTLGEGLKHLAIASVIIGLLSGITAYLTMSTIPGLALLGGIVGPILIVAYLIAMPILAVIGMLIGGAILHLFCKIVGGQGSYGNYVGVLSKISAAITGTAMAILSVIGLIAALAGLPTYLMVAAITGLLSFIASLWVLVLEVLATQAVQKLSLGRAVVAVIVIPLVVGFVLAIIIGIALFAAIMAMVGAGSGATGLASLFT